MSALEGEKDSLSLKTEGYQSLNQTKERQRVDDFLLDSEEDEINVVYSDAIKKIRIIVRKFNKNALKNDYLHAGLGQGKARKMKLGGAW